MVGRLRNGLAELFALPDGYEVLLGNGGTTVFWDAAVFGLIDRRSQHLVFGEFSSKFADAAPAAPLLDEPSMPEASRARRRPRSPRTASTLYAFTHNETSTGVAMPLRRPEGADAGALVAVDATSAAGGLRFDPGQYDVYYFAPQKCFGLRRRPLARRLLAGRHRADRAHRGVGPLGTGVARPRHRPRELPARPDLQHARRWPRSSSPCSRSSGSTTSGGLSWAAGRCDRSAETIYGWAEASDFATPFVADPAERSHVVATIDLDDASTPPRSPASCGPTASSTPSSYRKLGRNQLRVALFPAIEPDDVVALTDVHRPRRAP